MTINHKFSLLELTIVLAIMAVAASLTISMVEEIGQQPRVDKTYEMGKSIQKLISGNGIETSRFISDMGRLPVVAATNNILGELSNSTCVDSSIMWDTHVYNWSPIPGETFADSGLSGIVLPCGWNGPYFYNGQPAITDGWGNQWQIKNSSGGGFISSPSAGSTIFGIRSLGADMSAGGTTWADNDLSFSFDESFMKATLTVTVLMKKALPAEIIVPEKPTTISTWAADHSYQIGDEIIESYLDSGGITRHSLFKCVDTISSQSGTSGTIEPMWQTTLAGDVTTDSDLAWEYMGSGDSSKPTWTANSVYGIGSEVESTDSGFGTKRFHCKYIIPSQSKSGSTKPTWNTGLGGKTYDNHRIIWECFEDTSRINRLRIALFEPDITSTTLSIKRLMALHDGDELSGELMVNSSITETNLEWDSYNTFTFTNISVGQRKLYAYGYYDTGSSNINKLGSSIININLKPGANHITVHLTRKLD